MKEGEEITHKTSTYMYYTNTDNRVVVARGKQGGGKGRWAKGA